MPRRQAHQADVRPVRLATSRTHHWQKHRQYARIAITPHRRRPLTAVGHYVHGGQRTQLNLQHPHGHHAEAFGFLVHLDGGALVGVEVFQGLKALEIVEERGAHIGVAHPVLFEGAGGGHGDDAGHDDDERRADQHDGSSGHVNRRNGHEQGDWRKNRIEELRQEQFKEALNLFNTFAGGLHHIRGLDAGL